MDRILITGFENFGDYNENITEVLSTKIFELLVKRESLLRYSLEYMIFPVRIFSNGAENYGKQIIAKAQEINAKAIISLGMASDVKGLRIESQAINWVENKKYCISSEQRRVIDDSSGPKHTLQIDLKKWNIQEIFSAFNNRNIVYEAEVSADANSFCCNALIFRTLQAAQNEGCNIPYIYLHIPCSRSAVKGLSNFDKRKQLISIYDVEDILTIFLQHYI